jgi:FixJ family two-component response regulator
MSVTGWVDLATYASGFEANLAIAQLEASGVRAVRDDNDTVGIFGPGYQGTNVRGVTVRVPVELLEEARVVLAAESDIPMTVLAMKAGAAEFLLKPLADEELLTAVHHAVARSRTSLSRKAEVWELRSRYESLSVREQQVMARVVAGHLNKRIGAALGISEITVKAHRGRVMHKMGAESLAELVTMGMRLELPSVPAMTSPIASSRTDYSLTA